MTKINCYLGICIRFKYGFIPSVCSRSLVACCVVFVVTVSLLYLTEHQAHVCESLLHNTFREMIY